MSDVFRKRQDIVIFSGSSSILLFAKKDAVKAAKANLDRKFPTVH